MDRKKYMNLHIGKDRFFYAKHPDTWKWIDALSCLGLWVGNGIIAEQKLYKEFWVAMNSITAIDIDTEIDNPGIWFVSDSDGMTIGFGNIDLRIDDNLPDRRVVIVRGGDCVSFDWRGRMLYEDVLITWRNDYQKYLEEYRLNCLSNRLNDR